MVGSGPQQISPPHVESANVHQQGELHNLEHGNHIDNQQEGSSQTLHAGGSGYRRKSHLVHEQADFSPNEPSKSKTLIMGSK